MIEWLKKELAGADAFEVEVDLATHVPTTLTGALTAVDEHGLVLNYTEERGDDGGCTFNKCIPWSQIHTVKVVYL